MEKNNISDFLKLSREEQKTTLEILLFSTDEPLSQKKLNKMLLFNNSNGNNHNDNYIEIETDHNEVEFFAKLNISEEYIQGLIDEINQDLILTNRPFQIVKFAGGWQYATRPEYAELIAKVLKINPKRKLSQQALETLAIIAYKQPITKPEIDSIRGVNSSEIINSLIEKKLIKIIGRKDVIGRPLLYATTNEFLKTFGLNSLKELPEITELEESNDQEKLFDENKQEILLSVVNHSNNEHNTNIIINKPEEDMANYDDDFLNNEILDDSYDENYDENYDDNYDDNKDENEFIDDELNTIPDEFIDDSFENYGEDDDESIF